MLSSFLRSLLLLSVFLLPKALFAEPNPVYGTIDAIYYDNYPDSPRHHVAGWACAYGLPQSIAVHVYAGGPAGTGHFVTAVMADQPSDQAVANVCGSTGTAYRFDIDLYLLLTENFGQPLYIHGISPNGGANSLIGNSGVFNFPDSITANVFGDPMVIRTPFSLGGAIGSIFWRGKEFVNSEDHGREFQIAASLNGDKECYNPNEAGSLEDGSGTDPGTSLVSQYQITDPNRFLTDSYPAFWMWPGQTELSPGGARQFYCRDDIPNQTAVNTTARSNFQFYKTVTVGAFEMQNVIQVDTGVWLSEAISSAEIESLVGSLTHADFPQVMTYDVVTKTATTIDDPYQYPYGQTYVNRPAIFASADGQYALGVYNQQINHSLNPGAGDHYRVGRTPSAGINSFSSTLVFNSTTGPYSWSFTNYLVIGTLQDVLNSMDVLHQNLP